MAPRTLASLAHALAAAPDLDAALVALGEGLAEVDRLAYVALLRYDGRRDMLVDRLTPTSGTVNRTPVETTFDHLSTPIRQAVSAGVQFIDLGEQSQEYARLFGMTPFADGGLLALRGIRFDGYLAGVIALYESKKIFGTRASERFAPFVALFELGFARFAEREARDEAVRHVEDVTQRVHGEYVKKLAAVQRRLGGEGEATARIVALEADVARVAEEARRAGVRADAAEQQAAEAAAQVKQSHGELYRRSEMLRQKIRTLYLIDKVLTLDNGATDPRKLMASHDHN